MLNAIRSRAGPALLAAALLCSTTSFAQTPTTIIYKYDALGQLTGSMRDGQPRSVYRYDQAGNRTMSQVFALGACPATAGLSSGQELPVGCTIRSSSGAYSLYIEPSNGDLVFRSADASIRWHSDAYGSPLRLAMQADGDLVELGSAGTIWSSATAGHAGSELRIGDDGYLRIFDGAQEIWRKPVSFTGVTPQPCPSGYRSQLASTEFVDQGCALFSASGRYFLQMTNGGGPDFYDSLNSGGGPLWQAGVAGLRLQMQGDGNLVLLNAAGGSVWSSATPGHPGAHLELGNDGYVRVLDGTSELWKRPAPAPPPPCPAGSTLGPNQVLPGGSCLTSPNGAYRLYQQGDQNGSGNLVLYRVSDFAPLWSSERIGANLVMQSDGNLVEYPASGGAVWTSETANHPGAVLSVGDDGVMRVGDGSGVLWSRASDTLRAGQSIAPGDHLDTAGGRCRLEFDASGLIFRRLGGEEIFRLQWTTGAGSRLQMQAAGNLVLLNDQGSPVWGNPSTGLVEQSRLVLQTDGNLVVYDPQNNPTWASNTAQEGRCS